MVKSLNVGMFHQSRYSSGFAARSVIGFLLVAAILAPYLIGKFAPSAYSQVSGKVHPVSHNELLRRRRAQQVDPGQSKDYKLVAIGWSGNSDRQTIVVVRGGRVTRVIHSSLADIGRGRVYFFEHDDLVGVYQRSMTRDTFAGNGVPFHQGRLEDMKIERIQFRNGHIAAWQGADGQALAFDSVRFEKMEEALRQDVRWPLEAMKNREVWSFEALSTQDIDHPLLTAIFCGNASEALRISSGLEPRHVETELLNQACLAAVELGSPELVEALLERGADIMYRNGMGYTRTAAWYGHTEVMKVLIRHGARTDVQDLHLFPIQYAARNGHLEMLQLLLEQKPLPIPPVYELPLASSLLMDATSYDRLAILQFLDTRGILASAPLDLYHQLVQKAASKGSSHTLAFLLESPVRATASPPADLGAALWATISGPDASAAHILLANGANPDSRDADGKTPLMEVCDRASTISSPDWRPFIEILLDAGADAGAADRQGKTVLEYASGLNGDEHYKRLLHGATSKGQTGFLKALGAAAEGDQVAALDALRSRRPDLDLTREAAEPFRRCLVAGRAESAAWFLRQGFDLRAAQVAAPAAVVMENVQYDFEWKPRERLVNLLASAGADLNARDASGATALDYAWFIPFAWRKPYIERLESLGACDSFVKSVAVGDLAGLKAARASARPLHFTDRAGNTLVHIAAREGQPATIEFLASAGVPIDRPNGKQKTPLWVALEEEKLSAAEVLVRLGAKIDSRGDGGRTILFNLVDTASPLVVRFLLEHGADLRPKTNHAWELPIISQLLCNPGLQARSEVAELLLHHGADLDFQNGDGETMLHHAASGGWEGDVRWLVEHRANVNVRSKAGRTPIGSALERKHLEIADYLRTHGGRE